MARNGRQNRLESFVTLIESDIWQKYVLELFTVIEVT